MAQTETETETAESDAALDALEHLSDVTNSSIEGLTEVNVQLDSALRRLGQGWSWHRIVSSTDLAGCMAALASIGASLARAGGGFRRSLAQALRDEGIRVTEIGGFLAVSRQRVSALLRHQRAADTTGPVPSDAIR
jgi:hypothetical protein